MPKDKFRWTAKIMDGEKNESGGIIAPVKRDLQEKSEEPKEESRSQEKKDFILDSEFGS